MHGAESSAAIPPRSGILGAMGLNPFRPQRVSPADIAMVVGAVVVVTLLVGWALFG